MLYERKYLYCMYSQNSNKLFGREKERANLKLIEWQSLYLESPIIQRSIVKLCGTMSPTPLSQRPHRGDRRFIQSLVWPLKGQSMRVALTQPYISMFEKKQLLESTSILGGIAFSSLSDLCIFLSLFEKYIVSKRKKRDG
jgi:hypothetical protein